ncbi:hypothetical protein HY745_06935 [Candidatus Desantisbacteria bacterium]|nr:hypothetical protein [Candidatus Desantisbacteria bacterium]
MKDINEKFIVFAVILAILVLPHVLTASEENQLIDIPTAAIVRKGNYQITTRLYKDGGLLVRGNIGLMQRFNLGISYGGTRIIDQEDPELNPSPSVDIKYRLSDGGVGLPAIAVGYDQQGLGASIKDINVKDPVYKRYRNKSKGFYLVTTLEFKSLGGLEAHGGANYSFEDRDDKTGSAFFGINKKIGPEIIMMADYDLALNDDATYSYGNGKGYLNAGLRWYFAPELALEFDMLNLTENGKNQGSDKINRIIKICYTNYF